MIENNLIKNEFNFNLNLKFLLSLKWWKKLFRNNISISEAIEMVYEASNYSDIYNKHVDSKMTVEGHKKYCFEQLRGAVKDRKINVYGYKLGAKKEHKLSIKELHEEDYASLYDPNFNKKERPYREVFFKKKELKKFLKDLKKENIEE